MVYLLYGANTYEIDRAQRALLENLSAKYPGVTPQSVDAAEIEPSDLPDIFQGTSLFSDRRIVTLRAPSTHKALWAALEGYADKVPDETDIIITDSGADKRTKTFKALQKYASVHEYAEFGPRNLSIVRKWVTDEAKRQGVTIDSRSVGLLVERVGYDQWALGNALVKLALVDDTSEATIKNLIEPSPSANAFELFERAVEGDSATVRAMLADLQMTADPYSLIGLLGSQAYQLAVVAYSSKPLDAVAKALGMKSTYPLQKLGPLARRLSKPQVRTIIDALAECDRDLKRSVAPPWTLITRALLKISGS